VNYSANRFQSSFVSAPASPVRGVDWSNCDLHNLNFTNYVFIDSNLSGANLSGTDMTNVSFSRTDLSYANLDKTYMVNTNQVFGCLNGSYMQAVYACLPSDLSHATVTNATAYGPFSGWNLSYANFQGTNGIPYQYGTNPPTVTGATCTNGKVIVGTTCPA
jgi:hypothetical protein